MISAPDAIDPKLDFPDEHIEEVDVSTEMRGSFLEYAYSVIYSRALPDARDGMKPVQRRILYQMNQMGLHHDVGHVKSSRVVGEVMGKLHPHGDAAIYDALVRLAQSFNLRVPLIDGHGNFGSLDDGPAAPRYTEARLSREAKALTEQLDEDTVDFVPNYDNQFQQPEVLPAAFPSLLVNGASGIAVGMATNIPCHNPVETINAAIYLLQHPDAATADLMKFVPGPDFPGGGIIMGLDGVRDAYETGRGSFKVRAKCQVERVSARRNGIVVTELPYMVGPERVIEKIKDGVSSGRLKGIAAVSDLTDRELGLRLQIDIKTGFDPQAVLAQLYKHTPLEDSFSVNAVALVQGSPQVLSLRDMLQVFVDHRLEVTARRTNFRLTKCRDRLHLVEGLLRAVLNIDEVIQIIRQSEDSVVAKERLQHSFALSEIQAEYILELRLRRLTKFSTLELENEQRDLLEQIAKLEQVLTSSQMLKATVVSDLQASAKLLQSPRRTTLVDSSGEALPEAIALSTVATATKNASLEIADSPCLVVLSLSGKVARIPLSQQGIISLEDFAAQGLVEQDNLDVTTGDTTGQAPGAVAGAKAKGATDLAAALASLEGADALLCSLETTARSEFAVLTADGMAHRLDAVALPELAYSQDDFSLQEAVPLDSILQTNSPVVTLLPLQTEEPVALATEQGRVKRVRPQYPESKDSWALINLSADDQLIGASARGNDCVGVFITRLAQLLVIDLDAVRPQGITAAGMAGIKLAENDQVIAFAVVAKSQLADAWVLTVAGLSTELPGINAGSAKLSPLSDFPLKGRAGQGVRSQRFLRGQDQLALAWVGVHVPKAFTSKMQRVDLPEPAVRRDASGTPLFAPIRYVS